MTDFAKLRKLLNLTSSPDDAEALSALRLAQKICGNLGDYLSAEGQGLSPASASKDALYEELESLYESEVKKAANLKEQNEDKDKTIRKNQRDLQNLKRRSKDYESKIEDLEAELAKAQPKTALTGSAQQYKELEQLFEAEVDKNEVLKDRLDQKEKSLQKYMRDATKFKRELSSTEAKMETLEKTVDQLTEELFAMKRDRSHRDASPN